MIVRVIRRTDVARVIVLFIRMRLDFSSESVAIGATKVKARVAKRLSLGCWQKR